jgi:tetratricopeptide (TPR) repeat protein
VRLFQLFTAVLVSALAGVAEADTIVLEGGQVLEADQAWYEGSVLRYRKDGQLWDLPREAVSGVQPSNPEGTLLDPHVLDSREQLAGGDASAALRFARLALFRDPSSPTGLEALAAAQLALGQPRRAQASAEEALRLDPRRGRSLELLGDSAAALGERDTARQWYRAAYDLESDRRLQRKIEDLEPRSSQVSSARFRIRYDGTADEPLGLGVLGVLDRSWEEYEKWLGFSPDLPITVVLTSSSFGDSPRAPEWAAAWNDGTIRVPVLGIERPDRELIVLLRHELAHSFLATHIGSATPTWLHEGLAQWLEGGDPTRGDAALAPSARSGRLWPLEQLGPPFGGLSEAQATSAYVQSLSAVALLLRLRGPEGIRALIEALAAGRSTDDALQESFDLRYEGLQRAWETHLKTADRGGSMVSAER